MKPADDSLWTSFLETLKRIYITKIKGFDVHKMCVATVVMEGTTEVINLFILTNY